MENFGEKGRLLIVSNRLPVVVSKEEEKLQVLAGTGGLVTALAPVLRNRGGIWIGWPGLIEEEEQTHASELLKKEQRNIGYTLKPIFLNKEEVRNYYDGFSNEIIWPLFHDLQSLCRFNPVYWETYKEVNHKFALGISECLRKNDFTWINDYHLMLVGQELRKMGVQQKIGFFLHIPFPPLDIFVKLPWRFQILHALLEYDQLGFQTIRDLRNFLHCIKRLLPELKITNKRHTHTCQVGDREVRLAAIPISIDFKDFNSAASSPEVKKLAAEYLKKYEGKKLVFSCDRLDMSKGIPDRLKAIQYLLKTHPELHGKVTFFQVVVPSRIDIPGYRDLKNEIDRLVSEINSQFTQAGWVPIHYIYNSISRTELITFYLIAEIALITPIKDGMNLVAKEYVAANFKEDAVLVLSEFAGAVTQLQHEALLINPYDIVGVAEAIHEALTMSLAERKQRMHKMRRNVQHYDVFWWVRTFLNAAITKELSDFPVVDEYSPTNHVLQSH